MGHPVLRKKTRPLTREEIKSPAFKQLVADMIETMHEYDGVGLAAPQIHEPVQVAIIEIAAENPRYPDESETKLTVFINPVVKILDKKEESFWEGCLSVPGMRGLVHRPRKVRVKYLDVAGKEREITAEGFLATVLQHELDHLDGVLYIDKIRDPKNLAFNEEYQRYLSEP